MLRRHWRAQLLAACLLLPLMDTAQAQQTTGVLGSPDATTTIDGRYLPAPPQKFEGEISLNATLLIGARVGAAVAQVLTGELGSRRATTTVENSCSTAEIWQ